MKFTRPFRILVGIVMVPASQGAEPTAVEKALLTQNIRVIELNESEIGFTYLACLLQTLYPEIKENEPLPTLLQAIHEIQKNRPNQTADLYSIAGGGYGLFVGAIPDWLTEYHQPPSNSLREIAAKTVRWLHKINLHQK